MEHMYYQIRISTARDDFVKLTNASEAINDVLG